MKQTTFWDMSIIQEWLKEHIRPGRLHADSQNEKRCLFFFAFEYQGDVLYRKQLLDTVKDSDITPIQLNFDFLCWEPAHFFTHVREQLSNSAGELGVSVDWENREGASERDIAALFRPFDHSLKSAHRRALVCINSFHSIHTLCHYRETRDVLQQFRKLIPTLSALAFICFSEPPRRKQKAFTSLVSESYVNSEWIPAIDVTRFIAYWAEWRKKYPILNCRELYRMSGGYAGYILPIIQSLILMPPLETHQTTESYLRYLVESGPSPLNLYLSRRYFLSLERAKGFGSLRLVLSEIVREEHRSLSQIARSVHKSPQAVKDYLDSLVENGLLLRLNKHYACTDSLFKLWLQTMDAQRGLISEQAMAKWNVTAPPASKPSQKPSDAWKNNSFVEFD